MGSLFEPPRFKKLSINIFPEHPHVVACLPSRRAKKPWEKKPRGCMRWIPRGILRRQRPSYQTFNPQLASLTLESVLGSVFETSGGKHWCLVCAALEHRSTVGWASKPKIAPTALSREENVHWEPRITPWLTRIIPLRQYWGIILLYMATDWRFLRPKKRMPRLRLKSASRPVDEFASWTLTNQYC